MPLLHKKKSPFVQSPMHSSLNKALSGGGGIPYIDNSARTLKKSSNDYGLSPNNKLLESNKKQKKVSTS